MIAVYAGSFDPPTTGHEWMIREAARLFHHRFQQLIVAIGVNPDKQVTFSLEQRRAWIEMIAGEIVTEFGFLVCVESFEGYLVKYAVSRGATYIVRGIRNLGDFTYEQSMRHINSDLQPNIQTIFLMPPRHLSEISSSIVKGLIGPTGWQDVVRQYLPPCVFESICREHD